MIKSKSYSNYVRFVKSVLNEIGVDYQRQSYNEELYSEECGICFAFDFVIPDLNIAIDINVFRKYIEGKRVYAAVNKRLNVEDKLKENFVSRHGIKLISLESRAHSIIKKQILESCKLAQSLCA